MSAGRPYFGEVTLSKYVDQYSPRLFGFLTTAVPLAVTLAWITTKPETGGVVVKTVYYFNDAYLTNLANVRGEEQPAERLSFLWRSFAMDSAYQTGSGVQVVNAESWDVGRSGRCVSPDCPLWMLSP